MIRNRKIILAFCMSFLLLCSLAVFSGEVEASSEIKVYLNEKLLVFENKPFIENGVTLVEFRPIFEGLALDIKWDGHNKIVSGSNYINEIYLQIDNYNAVVNGEYVVLDITPKVINGRTFVPLRFVSQAVGATVEWDGVNKAVYIEYDYHAQLRATIEELGLMMEISEEEAIEFKEEWVETIKDVEIFTIVLRDRFLGLTEDADFNIPEVVHDFLEDYVYTYEIDQIFIKTVIVPEDYQEDWQEFIGFVQDDFKLLKITKQIAENLKSGEDRVTALEEIEKMKDLHLDHKEKLNRYLELNN